MKDFNNYSPFNEGEVFGFVDRNDDSFEIFL